MALTHIAVTGCYLGEDGTPAAGMVTFTLSEEIRDGLSGLRQQARFFTAPLDRDGSFCLALVANDDPTTRPCGTCYEVREFINGACPQSYRVVIPHAAPGGTVDLATLPHVTEKPAMSPMEQAFLADILANPEDDAPRLIYADWLEERAAAVDRSELREAREAIEVLSRDQFMVLPESPRGQRIEAIRKRQRELEEMLAGAERAEFIRVQCRYAQLWCAGVSTADIRMHDLECREKELLDAHGLSEWVPDGWEGWVEGKRSFRRGFIECLRMPGDAWVEHADTLLAAQPIREVTLTSLPDTEITDANPIHGSMTTVYRVTFRSERWTRHVTLPAAAGRTPKAILDTRLLLDTALERVWPRIRFNRQSAGGPINCHDIRLDGTATGLAPSPAGG